MTERTFIILGASLAGAKAAEELREQGFDGKLVLVGSELERPYERPPLTKDYLRGESEREKAYVHPERFYDEHDIELLSGVTATSIDPAASTVALDDGRELHYDRLLLTTGAQPREITVPGADLDGVHYLRTLDDCDTLKTRLDAGGRVVVVGGGWIGSEFAASARQKGLRGGADRSARAARRTPVRRRRSARSTATSTPSTASSCCSATGCDRSRATAPSRA